MTRDERRRVDAAFRSYMTEVVAGTIRDDELAVLADRIRATALGKGNDSAVRAPDVVPRPQVTH